MEFIGIDHGNGNMKTENIVFPCGFKVQETKPSSLFAKDIIEYNEMFYSLTTNRNSYSTDKTKTNDAFILTLFSIAKEIIAREQIKRESFDFKKDFKGYIGKDVLLAVGLPPAHIENKSVNFKEYFLEKAKYGIKFKYNDKPFDFYLKDVVVLPQDYAAAIVFKQDMLQKYSTCYCIDIGDGTVDMVGLTAGVPDKDTIVSREFAMSKLRSMIIDDVINDYGITLDNKTVEDFLFGKELGIAPDLAEKIKERIDRTSEEFATELINQLHTKVADFRVFPVIFCGGGALALRKYFDRSGAFGMTEYIEDIHANAIGYQELARLSLKMAG